MNEELIPCPFCGGEARFHDCIELENDTLKGIYGGKVGVHCGVCGVATQPYESKKDAVETWNRRVNNG